MSRALPWLCSLGCLCRRCVLPRCNVRPQMDCSAPQWKLTAPLFFHLWLHQVSHEHRCCPCHQPLSPRHAHSTIVVTFGTKRVSTLFTTNTSDSEFPFACHGFVQINLARQLQEPKSIPFSQQSQHKTRQQMILKVSLQGIRPGSKYDAHLRCTSVWRSLFHRTSNQDMMENQSSLPRFTTCSEQSNSNSNWRLISNIDGRPWTIKLSCWKHKSCLLYTSPSPRD